MLKGLRVTFNGLLEFFSLKVECAKIVECRTIGRLIVDQTSEVWLCFPRVNVLEHKPAQLAQRLQVLEAKKGTRFIIEPGYVRSDFRGLPLGRSVCPSCSRTADWLIKALLP